MKQTHKELIHHISRLEGQLASIKNELGKEAPDCEKTASTLRAAARSFGTLRMSFVQCFLEKKYKVSPKETDTTYTALLHVINA